MHNIGHIIALVIATTSAPADGPSIAVVPVEVRGDAAGSTADIEPQGVVDALVDGVARAEIPTARLEGACAERQCWIGQARASGYDHVIFPKLERRGPDSLLSLDVVAVDDGSVVASTERACDICGQRELLTTASNLAAVLSPRLARLDEDPTLSIEGVPRGAVVDIDGLEVGTLPWEGTVSPGAHRVRVTQSEYLATERTIVTDAGVHEHVEISLAPMPVVEPPALASTPEPDVESSSGRQSSLPLLFGGAIGGAGLAMVGVGVGLFAVDGRAHRASCIPPLVDDSGRCPLLRETTRAAIVVTSVGTVAFVTGAAILTSALVRRRRDRDGGR